MHIYNSYHTPYTYKFSRDAIFAVFVDNLSSTKIKSSKFKNNHNGYEAEGLITNDT